MGGLLWLKALHIFAVMAWMAGMFYLPRLFAYHANSETGSELASTLGVMEHRLMRIIMAPAIVGVWVSGVFLVLAYAHFMGGFFVYFSENLWLYPKLVCVLVMTLLHFKCVGWRKQLANGVCQHSSSFFRKVNEIPTVLALIIIVFAVVKPV